MCKFIICHLFALLLISASTQAVNWRVEFLETYIETSGSHEGQEYLSPGIVTIEIYLNNTDRIFTGWSTPFKFSGSVSLNGAGKKFTTTAFKNLWDMGTFEAEESWDGDLSTPDQYNFSGIGLTGYQPGMGEIRAFVFQFYVVDSGEDCATPQGLFCIDSGDFSDDTNDWLFDPALPFIGETCYSVKSTCCAGTTSGPIVDTPDKELVGFIGEELTWDFSEEPDPQLYIYNVIGLFDYETAIWTHIPQEGYVGPSRGLVTNDDFSGPCDDLSQRGYFYFHVYDRPWGDANGDGAINILDISYFIAYVYAYGAEPDPIEIVDMNNDGSINILDIVGLIDYIYAIKG